MNCLTWPRIGPSCKYLITNRRGIYINCHNIRSTCLVKDHSYFPIYHLSSTSCPVSSVGSTSPIIVIVKGLQVSSCIFIYDVHTVYTSFVTVEIYLAEDYDSVIFMIKFASFKISTLRRHAISIIPFKPLEAQLPSVLSNERPPPRHWVVKVKQVGVCVGVATDIYKVIGFVI